MLGLCCEGVQKEDFLASGPQCNNVLSYHNTYPYAIPAVALTRHNLIGQSAIYNKMKNISPVPLSAPVAGSRRTDPRLMGSLKPCRIVHKRSCSLHELSAQRWESLECFFHIQWCMRCTMLAYRINRLSFYLSWSYGEV